MEQVDRYTRQAVEMVTLGQGAAGVRRSTRKTRRLRDAYGRDSLGEKALLARRLVEAGVTFVLVSGAWGYFDHHGDKVRWGGIEKGLTPILPASIGRSPPDQRPRSARPARLDAGPDDGRIRPRAGDDADAGRDHWTNCMSMIVAGGGLRHGQVIGSTDRKGIRHPRAQGHAPDLAATVFRHLGIDLDAHWINRRAGRSRS